MENRVQETAVDVQTRQTGSQPGASRSAWSNGQCVAAVPSASMFSPSFDLSLCRATLQSEGFEIPLSEMEAPLNTALDVRSVKRFMVFNSAIFHFMLAPVLYVVLWCAIFSTLHILVNDYWILCLSVSLVSIFITTAIIFMLHNSIKDISVNLDVRLVQVNEMMVKHKLLVGVADWVQNCTGNMKLYFIYWDMFPCLKALTETLEEQSFAASNKQNRLRSRMSHLVLVTEIPASENPEAAGSAVEEERPLLSNESTDGSTAVCQREGTKITNTYSLVPEVALPPQDKAHQLLMTCSPTYVKLLVSERLSGSPHHRLGSEMNHCSTAPLCLCQYITTKLLQ